jgi:hypothetical protein
MSGQELSANQSQPDFTLRPIVGWQKKGGDPEGNPQTQSLGEAHGSGPPPPKTFTLYTTYYSSLVNAPATVPAFCLLIFSECLNPRMVLD